MKMYNWYGAVGFCLLLVLSQAVAAIIQPPQDTVYRNGVNTTGHVTCVVNVDQPRSLFWIGSQVIYSNTQSFLNDNSDGKYSISDDATTTGDYTLVINRLSRNDTGTYRCQYGSEAKAASITVADPPGKPQIADPGELKENEVTSFTCTSEGGFPKPTFTWVKGGVELPATQATESTIDGKPASILQTRLLYTDHMSDLICRATNVLETQETFRRLDIKFEPRLEIEPKDIIVKLNTSFTLKCNITSNPAWTSMAWFRNGVQIASGQVTYTERNGISADSVYKCQADNGIGKPEVSTTVTVHYAPIVTITQGDNYAVDENNDLVLNCNVNAKPEATISWFKDDTEVGTTAVLTIPAVKRAQSGVYRCVAGNMINIGGNEERASSEDSVNVIVRYAPGIPSVEIADGSNEFNVGQVSALTCQLGTQDKGRPLASYKWYKQGSSTPLSSGETWRFNATSSEDTGFYYCEAANSVAKKNSEPVELKFYSQPQHVKIDARKADNATLGSSQAIRCVYSGYPAPSIQWYKNGQLLIPNEGYTQKDEITEVPNSVSYKVVSELSFQDGQRTGVEVTDFGLYSCKATNKAGDSKDNFEMQLNVIFPPEFTGYGKVASDLGKKVSLVCEVLSYPPASKIVFVHNGKELDVSTLQSNIGGSAHKQIMTHEIQSVSAEDYGSYLCVAANSIGESNSTVSLIKTSAPDAPTDIKASNITWETVNLSWKPGFDGGFDQTFKIDYNGEVVTTNNNDITLMRLYPGTKYTITVEGTNKHGSSETSEVTVQTSNMSLPTATLDFISENKTITVIVNAVGDYPYEYCVTVQGSDDLNNYKDLTECMVNIKNFVRADMEAYKHYRATVCISHRVDICSISKPASLPSVDEPNGNWTPIIIGIVIAVIVVLTVIAILVAFCVIKKRRAEKKKSAPSSNGHINPVMTSNGTNIQYSRSDGYHMSSDIELDDVDAVNPYASSKAAVMTQPQLSPQQHKEKEDYTYASVNKKSQNNLNNDPYAADYNRQLHMNIHDPSSLSDNSDAFDDDQPPSPYRPAELSFLGDHGLPYNRFPSISESGYSTPDSKQLKKVVYEVIV